jgi:hypothetical protein
MCLESHCLQRGGLAKEGAEVFARSFVQRITGGDCPKFSAVEPPPSPSRWDVTRKRGTDHARINYREKTALNPIA